MFSGWDVYYCRAAARRVTPCPSYRLLHQRGPSLPADDSGEQAPRCSSARGGRGRGRCSKKNGRCAPARAHEPQASARDSRLCTLSGTRCPGFSTRQYARCSDSTHLPPHATPHSHYDGVPRVRGCTVPPPCLELSIAIAPRWPAFGAPGPGPDPALPSRRSERQDGDEVNGEVCGRAPEVISIF